MADTEKNSTELRNTNDEKKAKNNKTDKEKKNLHEGHRARLRASFRKSDFTGFNEHQIVELLLFYCCPRKDTNELAHILINKFGSLAGILDAKYEELESVSGISENAATLFKIIPKILPIYYNAHFNDEDEIMYNNTDKLKELFQSCFVGLTHEEFRIACFDNNLRLINNVLISKGSPSSAPVEMRKIIEEVIKADATSLVIAHNHPKGSPSPSTADMAVTREISDAMRSIRVSLLDHIIVGESSVISMNEMAYINVFDH